MRSFATVIKTVEIQMVKIFQKWSDTEKEWRKILPNGYQTESKMLERRNSSVANQFLTALRKTIKR